jgi:hypothetical protein
MQDAVDEGGSHDLIAYDLAPFLEALVSREDGGGVFVASAHEPEEEDCTGLANRQVADFVDHEQRRVAEYVESACQSFGSSTDDQRLRSPSSAI